jgi:hypothetical protein
MIKKTDITLKIGDSVLVKKGVKDPDSGIKVEGWQGRIIEIRKEQKETIINIAWDSITLQNIPKSYIEDSINDGLEWKEMYLGVDEVEKAKPRDTKKDVDKVEREIEVNTGWLWLGEEGKRIQKILSGINTDDEMGLLEAWEEYLEENLSFPFEAEVSEPQDRGPIRTGEKLTVTDISGVDDKYGIIVGVKRGRARFEFPLCDLSVTGKKSSNKQNVKDYAVWFANR